jgi:hypothetical protein
MVLAMDLAAKSNDVCLIICQAMKETCLKSKDEGSNQPALTSRIIALLYLISDILFNSSKVSHAW